MKKHYLKLLSDENCRIATRFMKIFVVYYTNEELDRLFSIFEIPSKYVTYQREYEKMVKLKGVEKMEEI